MLTIFVPPKHRVGDDEPAREPDGQIQSPAEERGENDGRRIDRDAGGETALHQKQKRAEESRFLIEPLPEILVGGENFKPLENRAQKSRRQRSARTVVRNNFG